MSETNDHHNDLVRASYAQRAASYDDANGGWHIKLGQDFVSWLKPEPGQTALDLACGTGLVTFPLAKSLGATGKVVAVDLTAEMIQVGQQTSKSLQSSGAAKDSAPVTWVLNDIASPQLLSEPAVQDVLATNGGFDIISVCSALVLLSDQQQALRFWTEKLLKKGGRIIIDVPTEDITLHFLMTYHLPVALGLSEELSKGRLMVKDCATLATAYQEVGLLVEQDFTTESYLETTWYDDDPKTGMDVLEKQIAGNYFNIAKSGKLEEARAVWPKLWQKAAKSRDNGDRGVEDAHRLYVCVGRKP